MSGSPIRAADNLAIQLNGEAFRFQFERLEKVNKGCAAGDLFRLSIDSDGQISSFRNSDFKFQVLGVRFHEQMFIRLTAHEAKLLTVNYYGPDT
jgi:hypothetical protein